MSKKKELPSSPSKAIEFPKCIKKNQARMVCLNPKCQQYPFFCTICQEDECEIIHHHGDKLSSFGFKEYIKKVLKQKKLDDNLQQALQKYEECLQKLKRDVEEFVDKQMNEIEEIRRKGTQMQQQEEEIIKKIKNKEYETLTGCNLDYLWQKTIEFEKGNNKNDETIQFLKMKEEQIEQISNNFQTLNKLELEDNSKSPSKMEKQKAEKDKNKKPTEQNKKKNETTTSVKGNKK